MTKTELINTIRQGIQPDINLEVLLHIAKELENDLPTTSKHIREHTLCLSKKIGEIIRLVEEELWLS